jgi:hypothetical protein
MPSERQNSVSAQGNGVIVPLGVEIMVVGKGVVPPDFGPDQDADQATKKI